MLEVEFWMTAKRGLTATSINLSDLDALLGFSVLCAACTHGNNYQVKVCEESNP